jgi:hypothetical protein
MTQKSTNPSVAPSDSKHWAPDTQQSIGKLPTWLSKVRKDTDVDRGYS